MLITVCAVALAVRYYGWNDTKTFEKTVYRMGYGEFPPYLMQKDGAPGGFAVDIVSEAARRLHLPIQWRRISDTTEKALTTGEVDLYPMLAMLPSRIGRMEFSEPWWENALMVASRPTAPIRNVAESEGKRISLIQMTFGLQRMKTLFPRAIPVPEKDNLTVAQSVCLGTSEGAILESRVASGLTLLPQCSKVELTTAWFPELNLTYGVGARLGLKREANLIQEEIVRMAQDGAMTRIGERWGIQVTNQQKLLGSLVAGTVREQKWRDMVLGAVLLLLLALGQGYRLRKARRKAEEALATRSEFIANISHEIRTPLNGMIGMTQVLQDTPLDATQRECSEVLQTSGETLLALINELLDFSKLEAGKLDVEELAFAPHRIVHEVAKLFEARAHENGVTITVQVEEGVPKAVLGDPIRLRQVLSNLVGNAVKFTGHGSIRVQVQLLPGEHARPTLRFEVIDTGCGVPADFADRIFEPFTQADGSTSRKHGGTGLGLAISKRLTELLGGRIGLVSRLGAGSTFWLEIPFGAAAAGAAASSLCDAAIEEQLGLHVLVAEDNLVNQRVLIAYLRKLGCTWTLTANGREAVAAARTESFDAVLMDGQMPEVDGFEATRLIRQLGKPHGEVPIIGVTACAFDDDKKRCLDAGMQSVLTKPLSAGHLRDRLRELGRTLAE